MNILTISVPIKHSRKMNFIDGSYSKENTGV